MASYTSRILFPSIVSDFTPYPIPLSARLSQAYCSDVGVESPYPLFSIKKIIGNFHTAARFYAS